MVRQLSGPEHNSPRPSRNLDGQLRFRILSPRGSFFLRRIKQKKIKLSPRPSRKLDGQLRLRILSPRGSFFLWRIKQKKIKFWGELRLRILSPRGSFFGWIAMSNHNKKRKFKFGWIVVWNHNKKLQIWLDCCVKPCFARLLCRIAFRNQRNRARRANAMPNILRTITSGPASSFHAILRPDSKSGRQKTLRKNSTGSNRHGEPQERKNAHFRPKVLPRVLRQVLPRFRRKTKTRQTEPKRAKRV